VAERLSPRLPNWGCESPGDGRTILTAATPYRHFLAGLLTSGRLGYDKSPKRQSATPFNPPYAASQRNRRKPDLPDDYRVRIFRRDK